MRTIWKYTMGISTTLEIPKDGEFLSVDLQGNDAVAWFLVDPNAPKEPRKFRLYGTGHPIHNDDHRYLATFQTPPLVMHLFEEQP